MATRRESTSRRRRRCWGNKGDSRQPLLELVNLVVVSVLPHLDYLTHVYSRNLTVTNKRCVSPIEDKVQVIKPLGVDPYSKSDLISCGKLLLESTPVTCRIIQGSLCHSSQVEAVYLATRLIHCIKGGV